MDRVGNTPLIRLGSVFVKLECVNPCGSIKDRIATFIIEESERLGLLNPRMKIVEATSGNTGIALSYFAKEKGYDVTIVMPENMTEERKRIIKDLGANLLLCSAEGSFSEAAAIRNDISQDDQYFNPDQFSNPLNVECHYRTTGQEILSQMRQHQDSIDAFVAGVGTGGSLIGITKALKQVFPHVYVAAVEPSESAVMSGKSANNHGIQGIGDGFIPAIVEDKNGGISALIDEVICISTEEAKKSARHLEQAHNLCVGISSGANYLAARRLAKRFKTVVTLFPDGYSKYVSQGLQRCKPGACAYEENCGHVLKKLSNHLNSH